MHSGYMTKKKSVDNGQTPFKTPYRITTFLATSWKPAIGSLRSIHHIGLTAADRCGVHEGPVWAGSGHSAFRSYSAHHDLHPPRGLISNNHKHRSSEHPPTKKGGASRHRPAQIL